MKFLTLFTKTALLIFYAMTILSLVVPFLSEYRLVLWIVAVALVAIHAGEYLAMRNKMTNADPGQTNHLTKTLLFGYAHWLPLIRKR